MPGFGRAGLVLGVLCLLSQPAAAQLRADLVVSGLTQPVAFVQDPANPDIQVIVQQDGHIRVLQSGVLLSTDFLDLSGVVRNSGEQGLLGFAFAPDYATSRRFFVNFMSWTRGCSSEPVVSPVFPKVLRLGNPTGPKNTRVIW